MVRFESILKQKVFQSKDNIIYCSVQFSMTNFLKKINLIQFNAIYFALDFGKMIINAR